MPGSYAGKSELYAPHLPVPEWGSPGAVLPFLWSCVIFTNAFISHSNQGKQGPEVTTSAMAETRAWSQVSAASSRLLPFCTQLLLTGERNTNGRFQVQSWVPSAQPWLQSEPNSRSPLVSGSWQRLVPDSYSSPCFATELFHSVAHACTCCDGARERERERWGFIVIHWAPSHN